MKERSKSEIELLKIKREPLDRLKVTAALELFRVKHALNTMQMCKLLKLQFRTYKKLMDTESTTELYPFTEKKILVFNKKHGITL